MLESVLKRRPARAFMLLAGFLIIALLNGLIGCRDKSPTSPDHSLRINFTAPIDEGRDLQRVLYTIGDAQGEILTGEIVSSSPALTLSRQMADSLHPFRLRVYGYDDDLSLRWLRTWRLAEDTEIPDRVDLQLEPLAQATSFPMPPPYPDYHLTTGFRPFVELDTLRNEAGIPIRPFWCFDEPVISVHWITKIILSNFENFILSGADSFKTRGLFLTDWLLDRALSTPLDGIAFPETFDYPGHVLLPAPWNGAFTNGLTISVLVRAHIMTDDQKYLDAAEAAMRATAVPSGHVGGSTLVSDEGRFWIEEYPGFPPQHTLNGAIYGIWSILDWYFYTGDPAAERYYRAFVETLTHDLHYYDTGSWTYYDRWGLLATTGYQQIHTSQMGHLFEQTGLQIFADYQAIWQGYLDAGP